MSHNKALDNLTREQLVALLEIYAKNWLAADGIWFQSVEKRRGMEEAMYHDVEIWKRFTVVEALKLKMFLHLPERAGLEGLAKALSLGIDMSDHRTSSFNQRLLKINLSFAP